MSKRLEWNFLGPSHVGALGARDASPAVNGIGSMLDASKVGVPAGGKLPE